ncbi:MAG: hypothetical protein C7B46_15655 [Sulfobacillus benefaciens]|uniref:Peptidoglycan binding-like domain-containing protein n=1 Tax=Sulfobacillus benefaciens TaxID=453960 RepID=A0A2T2XC71_9FIRM|nr:MAG: hypothetical protein C7B46_15655 [Sulfobacillus benefaciens]
MSRIDRLLILCLVVSGAESPLWQVHPKFPWVTFSHMPSFLPYGLTHEVARIMAQFANGLPLYPFGSRRLRLTQKPLQGTDVKLLQRLYDMMLDLLNSPICLLGPRIAIFTEETRRAVIDIQSYFGFPITGVVDPLTFRALGQDKSASSGTAFGARPLQNRLNCLRYASLLDQAASGLR